MARNLRKRLRKIVLTLFPQYYKDKIFGSIEKKDISSLQKDRIFEPELLLLKKYIHSKNLTLKLKVIMLI